MMKFVVLSLSMIISVSALANTLEDEVNYRLSHSKRAEARRTCTQQQEKQFDKLTGKLLSRVETRLNAKKIKEEGSFYKFSNGAICDLSISTDVTVNDEAMVNLNKSTCVNADGVQFFINSKDEQFFIVLEPTCRL